MLNIARPPETVKLPTHISEPIIHTKLGPFFFRIYAYSIQKKPSMRELVINNGGVVTNSGMRMKFGV